MAAAIPGIAVCMAPPADELEEELPVAAEAADEALELALDATLLAFESKDEAELEAPARAELPVDEAPDARDEALSPAPPPKMVVEPTVVEKVEEPEVSTETKADVVMAEDPPAPAPVDEPDPPAPPTPKIVVEPTVVSKVEEPLVTVETRADVVIAEEDPPAPAP